MNTLLSFFWCPLNLAVFGFAGRTDNTVGVQTTSERELTLCQQGQILGLAAVGTSLKQITCQTEFPQITD